MRRASTIALAVLAAACHADSKTPPRREGAATADPHPAATSWSRERPRLASGPCEEDSVPLTVFTDSSASGPSLLVRASSLDTVGEFRIGALSDQCGVVAGFVRQISADPPEFLPLPPGFIDGLTTFGFDSTGRHIVYVEFDGRNGAFAVVRSVPDYALVVRSGRIEVPGGDVPCAFAGFDRGASWLAYLCTGDPDPQRYVRVRGRLGDSAMRIDTATLRAGDGHHP